MNTISEELPEDLDILDLAIIERNDVLVGIKAQRALIERLERFGRSLQCTTQSETVERMIDKIENGNTSHHVYIGGQTKRLIRAYLDSGKQLPVICALLNRSGQAAHDGKPWTTGKLSTYCQYHGLDYRQSE